MDEKSICGHKSFNCIFNFQPCKVFCDYVSSGTCLGHLQNFESQVSIMTTMQLQIQWFFCQISSSGNLGTLFFPIFQNLFQVFFFNIKKRTRSSIRKAFETRTQQVSKIIPTQQTLEYSTSKIRNGYYFEIHYLERKFQLLLQNIWGKVWSHLGIVFFVSGAVFHSFLFNFDHFLQICCLLILNLFFEMVINDSRLWLSQLISHSLNFGPMIFLWNDFAILQEITKKISF